MKDLQQLEIDAFLSQAEMLARLQALPAWESWVSLLHDMRKAMLEELARCVEPNDFRYWQGAVHALGEIIERPGRIVASADERLKAEEDEKAYRPELRQLVGAGVDPDGGF